MDPVTPVLPREGARLTGEASARAAEETVVQLDPIQDRLDELLRRLENQESLIRTLQATQVPLGESGFYPVVVPIRSDKPTGRGKGDSSQASRTSVARLVVARAEEF